MRAFKSDYCCKTREFLQTEQMTKFMKPVWVIQIRILLQKYSFFTKRADDNISCLT